MVVQAEKDPEQGLTSGKNKRVQVSKILQSRIESTTTTGPYNASLVFRYF
jgi:hypothetical protein